MWLRKELEGFGPLCLLNNSLSNWEEFTITPITSTSANISRGFYNAALKLVKIEFEVVNTNSWKAITPLGNIPEKYRPKGQRNISGSIMIDGSTIYQYVRFSIETNGNIQQRLSTQSYKYAKCFGIYNI